MTSFQKIVQKNPNSCQCTSLCLTPTAPAFNISINSFESTVHLSVHNWKLLGDFHFSENKLVKVTEFCNYCIKFWVWTSFGIAFTKVSWSGILYSVPSVDSPFEGNFEIVNLRVHNLERFGIFQTSILVNFDDFKFYWFGFRKGLFRFGLL